MSKRRNPTKKIKSRLSYIIKCICENNKLILEKFEDTEWIIRKCNSKDIQCNDEKKKKKRTNNVLQSTPQMNRDPIKKREYTKVFRKYNKFLVHL
jgi:hypothetical protein